MAGREASLGVAQDVGLPAALAGQCLAPPQLASLLAARAEDGPPHFQHGNWPWPSRTGSAGRCSATRQASGSGTTHPSGARLMRGLMDAPHDLRRVRRPGGGDHRPLKLLTVVGWWWPSLPASSGNTKTACSGHHRQLGVRGFWEEFGACSRTSSRSRRRSSISIHPLVYLVYHAEGHKPGSAGGHRKDERSYMEWVDA